MLVPFDGGDLDTWCRGWEKWLRMVGLSGADDRTKRDWLEKSMPAKTKRIIEMLPDTLSLTEVLARVNLLHPSLHNDLSTRAKLAEIPQLPTKPKPQQVPSLLLELHHACPQLSPGSMGSHERVLLLISKIPTAL